MGVAKAPIDIPERSVAAALAENLRQMGEFSNPFRAVGNTGPSAVEPPLYPLLLAAFEKAAGTQTEVLLLCLALAAIGLQSVLLVQASRIILGSPAAGWMAAGITNLLAVNKIWLWSGPLLAADLTLFAVLLTTLAIRRAAPVWMVGLPLGLVMLFHPPSAVVVMSFLVWVAIQEKKTARFLVAAVAVACCVILPWTLRNALRLHALIPVQESFGIELAAAFNDCTAVTENAALRQGCLAKTHPLFSTAENAKAAAAGEAAYAQKRLSEGVAWIATHRKEAAALTASRVAAFWFPSRCPGAWVVVLFGFGGVALLISHKQAVAAPLLACLLVYPLGSYFSLSREADLTPLLWALALPAGYVVIEASRRERIDHHAAPKQRPTMNSVVTAGLPKNVGT